MDAGRVGRTRPKIKTVLKTKTNPSILILRPYILFGPWYGRWLKMALTSSGGLEVQILYRTLDGHQVFRQIEEFVCQRDFCLIHLLFISCTLNIQAPYYHVDICYLNQSEVPLLSDQTQL